MTAGSFFLTSCGDSAEVPNISHVVPAPKPEFILNTAGHGQVSGAGINAYLSINPLNFETHTSDHAIVISDHSFQVESSVLDHAFGISSGEER